MLLLDEPLSALDLKLRKEMQLELKRLQTETGITFVFVTHDQEEALTMSDRIAVMDQGRVLQIGSPADIYDRPRSRFVADFIGETNLIERAVRGARGGRGAVPAGQRRGAGGGRSADGMVVGAKAMLAVRPERVELVAAERPGLPAVVDDVVYLGTDTIYHARLRDGTAIQARVQNRHGAVEPHHAGAAVARALRRRTRCAWWRTERHGREQPRGRAAAGSS